MREVILPSLPPLSESGKRKLITIVDVYARTHKENILHYLETGEVTFDELPGLANVPEIKAWLEQEYSVWFSQDSVARLDYSKSCYDFPSGTDVFFIGVPGSGKTCILMGLLNTCTFEWNVFRFGGKYGCALQTLCAVGEFPSATPPSFATVISGQIRDKNKSGVFHDINLVEISGRVSVSEQDGVASQMLVNQNEKVVFIVIDPTADVVKYRTMTELNGSREMAEIQLSQHLSIARFCEIISAEESKSILKRVRAIHFIVSKADVFGDRENRMQRAIELMSNRYDSILQTVRNLNHKFELPEPRVFLFSIGELNHHGVAHESYVYDPKDAEALLSLISEQVPGRNSY